MVTAYSHGYLTMSEDDGALLAQRGQAIGRTTGINRGVKSHPSSGRGLGNSRRPDARQEPASGITPVRQSFSSILPPTSTLRLEH